MKLTARKRRLVIGMALVLSCLALAACADDFAGLEVKILDVGQGDATLVRLDGTAMLIDAGPNATEEVLCATLQALEIDCLDALILTHPDEDHIGGADLLLDRVRVKAVYLAPQSGEDEAYPRLVEALARNGAAVHIGEAGVSFSLGDATVSLLAPLGVSDDTNAASIVTRITYGKTACLFMGDADAAVEAALLERYPDLRTDLIKIGHHGADSSTTDALLDAVRPTYAAISCGARNHYGHPARRVLDALSARGIVIARTDEQGSLTYRTDGEGLWQT